MYIEVDGFNEPFHKGQIKSLSCHLEYDPTLATVPSCQFEADIIDDHSPNSFQGASAILYDDPTTTSSSTGRKITTGYIITESYTIASGVIHIKAQSILYTLENIELKAKYYSYTTFETIVIDIFNAAGYAAETYPPFYIDSSIRSLRIYGYFPVQTARARLTMLLQVVGAIAQQWSPIDTEYIYFNMARDKSSDSAFIPYGSMLVSQSLTYLEPRIKKVGNISKYTYNLYSNWTTSWQEGMGESGYTGYPLEDSWVELDTGVPDTIYVYSQKEEISYGESQGQNSEVIINNTAMSDDNSYSHYEFFKRAYFRNYEIEVSFLANMHNNGVELANYILPNTLRRIFVDKTTIYYGVVKSVDYICGALNKIKAVLSSDLTQSTTKHLKVQYVYKKNNDERLLGTNDYYTDGGSISVAHPIIEAYVVDHLERFVPSSTPSTYTLSSTDQTVTQYYNRT